MCTIIIQKRHTVYHKFTENKLINNQYSISPQQRQNERDAMFSNMCF